MITIILYDNNRFNYKNFYEIPIEYYNQIKVIKCNNNNLYNIDFIANFPNLIKLNASNNRIKYIPFISKLEELDIYNNQLEELPPLLNLKKLYAFNNNLSTIPEFPNLEIMDVSNNKIINLVCGKNITHLYISYNNISTIKFKGNLVKDIECNSNSLTNFVFAKKLNNLQRIKYDNNPIELIYNYS